MYRVAYARAAQRQLERLARRAPVQDVRAVLAAVEGLATEPRPIGSVKLQGPENLHRLRVRDYRVVYFVDSVAQLVVITRVARRAEATYRGL